MLLGKKRGTSSSLWSYDAKGKRTPMVGDLSIMTAGDKTPLSVIETVEVQVMPFDCVTADFAFEEGEGDRTLAWWRSGHQHYFEREAFGKAWSFSLDMPIVCERFDVVYLALATGQFIRDTVCEKPARYTESTGNAM